VGIELRKSVEEFCRGLIQKNIPEFFWRGWGNLSESQLGKLASWRHSSFWDRHFNGIYPNVIGVKSLQGIRPISSGTHSKQELYTYNHLELLLEF